MIEPLRQILSTDAGLGKIFELLPTRLEVQATILEAARPFVISGLYQVLAKPILVVCSNFSRAQVLKQQIDAWLEEDLAFIFPESDNLSYQRLSRGLDSSPQRMNALDELLYPATSAPPLVICSAESLAYKILNRATYTSSRHTIKVSDEFNLLELLGYWQKLGYRLEELATGPAQVSHRGGIIDIYPVNLSQPVRIEFFGDTIEDMRGFDPATQRSTGKIDELVVAPASEMASAMLTPRDIMKKVLAGIDTTGMDERHRQIVTEDLSKISSGQYFEQISFYQPYFNNDSILSYLPPDVIVIVESPRAVEEAVDKRYSESNEIYRSMAESGQVPAGMPSAYFTGGQVGKMLAGCRRLELFDWQTGGTITAGFSPAPSFPQRFTAFIDQAQTLAARGKNVVIVSSQAQRLEELFSERKQAPVRSKLVIERGIIAPGWKWNDELYLFTDSEILGFIKKGRPERKRRTLASTLQSRIKPGDYVVHIENGIARFAGITLMNTAGVKREYLVLEYAESDRLYVPTDQTDRVSLYIGATDTPPALSRLGSGQWEQMKQRAEQATREMADELIALYSQREVIPGFSFSGDSMWQKELEASFPYVETDDQLTALSEIKGDMVEARPMDRLLLGDVGYGKTEVAIRAAFKAVQDGKQVAVLVPTTLLAQQHYITFTQRLGTFPVTVSSISRFNTPKEQNDILEAIEKGSLDIVIGTHRLIQPDVCFKNLGLIIIDEEQRFGVKHKEYLKKKWPQVDVLTLSATPIPRTLYMALSGVRNLSIIETPPEDRLPIRTYVSEHNPSLIREAILREIERGGQVFFVHNRVESIGVIFQKLEDLVHEARIGVAHGQLPEHELAKIMLDFTAGKLDVLVCTTIIESGLDVPNANTLIVNRADRLGLTQLHQLRGRVGRGTSTAYAYFIYPSEEKLTIDARKRLQTIYELAELGSGFNIAMRDLEIRGAGTLLGIRQSGYISSVGFNLYSEMLERAVRDKRSLMEGKKPEPESKIPEPSVNLPLSAFIPDNYIQDEASRIELYSRLASVSNDRELDEACETINDRFGPMPAEVSNLIFLVRVKLMAKTAGISSIVTRDSIVALYPYEGLEISPEMQAHARRIGLTAGSRQIRLQTNTPGKSWRRELEVLLGQSAA